MKEELDWNATPFVKSWLSGAHGLATDQKGLGKKINKCNLLEQINLRGFDRSVMCSIYICKLFNTHFPCQKNLSETYVYTYGTLLPPGSQLFNIY